MHIFIDESGGFQRTVQREHSISCVVAVTIPGRYLSDVENKLKPLAETWPKTPEGEIKGRLLDEEHIAALCALLKPLHVLLEASVMDMNLSTDQEIDYHQSKQAEGMTKNLTDQHHPNLIASVWDLRELLEKMPRQLYAQAASLTELVWKACENGQLYFCQRYPGELGRFRWVIDAKDADRVTPYEKWWRESVMGLVQAKSMRQPVVKLRGGDYSAFYRNFPSLPFPDYLKSDLANPPEKADDVKSILGRELEFSASGVHVGLQIADVFANALRRAFSNRLRRNGWRPIGQLMIHRREGAIRPINLGNRDGEVRTPYAAAMNELNRMGRSMLLSDRKLRTKRSS